MASPRFEFGMDIEDSSTEFSRTVYVTVHMCTNIEFRLLGNIKKLPHESVYVEFKPLTKLKSRTLVYLSTDLTVVHTLRLFQLT